MVFRGILIFSFLLLALPSEANNPHDFNFQALKNCFLQTNSNHPKHNHPNVQSHSRFVSTLIDETSFKSETQYNHQLDALVFEETVGSQTHVHIIQDVGGPNDNSGALLQGLSNYWNRRRPNIRETFIFNSSQIDGDCDSRQPQNVITVGGTCTSTTADSEGHQFCPTTAGLGFSVNSSANQTVCGVTHAFGERRGYSRRQNLPLTRTKELVEKALVDRLTYLQAVIRQPDIHIDRQNIISALSPGAACHQVITPTPPEVSALSSRVLCLLAPQNRELCLQGDGGRNFDDSQTGQSGQVIPNSEVPPSLLVPTSFEVEP